MEIAVQSKFGTAFWLALDRAMCDGHDDLATQVDSIIAITFDGIGTSPRT
ncbi:hypothetical protein [Mycobacterium sp. E1747]|nr:hypothetical protein [Mycobacterium sp. E1747]